MSESLLHKIRELNDIIQKSGSDSSHYSDLIDILGSLLSSNIYIIDYEGKMSDYTLISHEVSETFVLDFKDNPVLSGNLNRQLLEFDRTAVNIPMGENKNVARLTLNRIGKHIMIVPIICGGNRLGTLILGRPDKKYTNDDVILVECGATLIGKELTINKARIIEKRAREITAVQMALRTLSYSEMDAIEHIMVELGGSEGLVIASKIADRVGITRSVIVNALRKLESAGIIESRSLGMKGTHIKVLNNRLMPELEKHD